MGPTLYSKDATYTVAERFLLTKLNVIYEFEYCEIEVALHGRSWTIRIGVVFKNVCSMGPMTGKSFVR
jgi:hypothetical protein